MAYEGEILISIFLGQIEFQILYPKETNMTCNVLTTKGIQCKNWGGYYISDNRYKLCRLHKNIISKNFSNLSMGFWKSYPSQILIDFIRSFLESENMTVVTKLIAEQRYDMKCKFFHYDLSEKMAKLFFDSFGYIPLLEKALEDDIHSDIHVSALKLGFNPMTFILQTKMSKTKKPHTTDVYHEWLSRVFGFFVYTKAQFLHQKRCGLIVMTNIIAHLYPEIMNKFTNDIENVVMEICLVASNERPGKQCFQYTHGTTPFEQIKGHD